MNEGIYNLYLKELIEWNKKFNLTAITEAEEIRSRHFADSLSILQAIDLNGQKIVDIGSGAGFPGIPLKIERPNIKLTLIEATRKKADFLNHIVKLLGLSDVKVIWGRAEEYAQKAAFRGKFDIALARAVAKLPILVGYCLPFLKRGGLFIAQKQADVEEEIASAKKALEKFGAVLKEIKKIEINGIKRSLIVLQKL